MAGVEIHLLSSTYYQDPKGLSDKITVLFGPDSVACAKLIEAGKCILDFEQNNQRFSIPCTVVDLQPDDSFYQATFWHNSLFNPSLPGNVIILAFIPDWSESTAETIS